jgi:hypothetical protein
MNEFIFNTINGKYALITKLIEKWFIKKSKMDFEDWNNILDFVEAIYTRHEDMNKLRNERFEELVEIYREDFKNGN